MNVRVLTLVAVFFIAGLAGAAHAAPAWCKSAEEKPSHGGTLDGLPTEKDAREAVLTIVGATCFPDADATARAKQVEAARQTWSKRLAMTEADWADAAVWASRSQGERNSPTIYPRDQKAAWSTFAPVDQYGGILNSTIGDSSQTTDPAYVADAFGARLSEAGRLAYLTLCLRSELPVVWAMCEGDLTAFDAKKLSTELRGDTAHDGWQKTVIRIAGYQLAPQVAEHAARVKALVAKDPAYGKMFALAQAARAEWSKIDPALVALASAMDDARMTRSRKASEGCVDRTWTAWKGIVAAIPAKRFADLKDEPGNPFLQKAVAVVMGSPNGYLATLSLYLCASFGEKEDFLIRTAGGTIARWPGHRGPRNAAHTAILAAGLTLDERDAKLEYPDVKRPWIGEVGGSNGGGTGSVASVKVSGATATITFAKVKSKQTECTKGRYTNRVTMIRTDGVLVYEYVCEASKTVTLNLPPFDPQTVDARYAVGLKKGMTVSTTENVVISAYPAGGGAPAVIAGVPVK